MNRERQKRWDVENLRSVSTKFNPDEYRVLRRACDYQGITMYALVRQLLRTWLAEFARENPHAAEMCMRNDRA